MQHLIFSPLRIQDPLYWTSVYDNDELLRSNRAQLRFFFERPRKSGIDATQDHAELVCV